MKKRDIAKALKKKGFVEKQTHHTLYFFSGADGKDYNVKTYMSHGSSGKDIPDSIISDMATQCRLSKSDFQRLIDCTLSYEDYEKKLQK